jgi:hypothetical protein
METVDSLPPRPLTTSEVESLDGAAPYSGQPLLDRIFAIMLVTDELTYALGFDEDRESWIVIERADNDLGGEATERIDTAINEWVEDRYGEEYGNVQKEV